MPDTFRAWMIDSNKKDHDERLRMVDLTEDDLPKGDVTIDVKYSCLNYKDAAAIMGTSKIMRTDKCVPGIDLAGNVAKSDSPDFKKGDEVFVTGFGVGEDRHGGMAEKARVPSSFVTRMPKGMDARKVMSLGTAGFTAGLSIRALVNLGKLKKGADVLVTSVGGGVGSISAALVVAHGFKLHAVTRKEREDYARSFNPESVFYRDEFTSSIKTLDKKLWDGGIDTAGGAVLAKLLTQVKPEGIVACCGVTAGAEVQTTVMPFILRGITLKGINSVYVPQDIRQEVWDDISKHQEAIKKVEVKEVGLKEAPAAAEELIGGKVRGRVLVKVTG